MNLLQKLKRKSKSKAEVHETQIDESLLIAEMTYNTSHPDYDASIVRNFPGRIFNGEQSSNNAVYRALLPSIKKNAGFDEIPDVAWDDVLDQMLSEVKALPHSAQIFERKIFLENHLEELGRRYQAIYRAGWVNLVDALFLYWLVRTLKPKTIVQTGVCNGLSSAFIVLGLVKNGQGGKLFAIDFPYIFNPNDPTWTEAGREYGVFIPEGKRSGWLVPDVYCDHFSLQCGDAKELLPLLVDQLDGIDMFYHDSDHTYKHMMFEFNEIKRKLFTGGLIVADDISWNSSLWDFADMHQVPSYNYKGTMGTACF